MHAHLNQYKGGERTQVGDMQEQKHRPKSRAASSAQCFQLACLSWSWSADHGRNDSGYRSVLHFMVPVTGDDSISNNGGKNERKRDDEVE